MAGGAAGCYDRVRVSDPKPNSVRQIVLGEANPVPVSTAYSSEYFSHRLQVVCVEALRVRSLLWNVGDDKA
jgi:hypothetical protein